MAERWTKEQYESFLDGQKADWRQLRVAMPCTCDYEGCHGWAAVRLGREKEHEEEEADRTEIRVHSASENSYGS